MQDHPYYIIFDPNISDVPRKSLKMLRDTLSNSITQRIIVIEVPTSEVASGYLIFNKDSKKATWTGDSFRKAGEAEGASSYESAEALLSLFGIKPRRWKIVNLDELYFFPERKAKELLLGLVQEMEREFSDSDFFRPIERDPEYLKD